MGWTLAGTPLCALPPEISQPQDIAAAAEQAVQEAQNSAARHQAGQAAQEHECRQVQRQGPLLAKPVDRRKQEGTAGPLQRRDALHTLDLSEE